MYRGDLAPKEELSRHFLRQGLDSRSLIGRKPRADWLNVMQRIQGPEKTLRSKGGLLCAGSLGQAVRSLRRSLRHPCAALPHDRAMGQAVQEKWGNLKPSHKTQMQTIFAPFTKGPGARCCSKTQDPKRQKQHTDSPGSVGFVTF